MRDKIIEEILKFGNDVYIDEPMKCHVSFRIGGPVSAFVVSPSIEIFIKTFSFLKEIREVKVLGNGTNVLPKDSKMDFFILSTNRLNKIEILEDKIICESGLNLKSLCNITAKNGIAGFENLYGIPGSVGGAVYMNAGAYGSEIADLVLYVEAYDGNKIVRFNVNELKFSYRNSLFREEKDLIILRVAFKKFNDEPDLILEKMREIILKRVEKQPLEFPSAGSVFKRPRKDFYVGSAIEKAGLKGFKIGGAKVSEKHAGFIINYNNATYDDVVNLIKYIKEKIYENYKINLETEIEIW